MSTDSLVGRVLGDRYRLVSLVGTGASAQVYAAEDLALRRRVGAKVLHQALSGDPRFQKRFRNEAQNAAQMSHPRLLAVFDWNDSEDGAYLITELLTGGSLRHMLDASHKLSTSQTLVVGLHAAEGLQYAHELGFVHRDVKPANLLFGDDGRLRIADFGIARAVAEAAWTEPEGSLIGTARYAAPEQSSGGTVTGSADIYALGLTMIEAVTGQVPLLGSTPLATMVMRQETDVEVPAELGPLAEVVAAATVSDPEARTSAADFVVALREVASQLPRPMMLPLSGIEERINPANRTDAVLPRPHDAETGVIELNDGDKESYLEGFHAAETQIPDNYDPDTRWTDDPIPPPELPASAAYTTGAPVAEIAADGEPKKRGFIGRTFKKIFRLKVLLPLALIAGGFFAYTQLNKTPFGEPAVITHEVEDYTQGSLNDAVAAVQANGWTPNVRAVRRDGTTAGQVVSQSVEAGQELAEGSTVRLVVSDGPLLHLVPNLDGLRLNEARALLVAGNLQVGEITEVFDEEIPTQQIMAVGFETHTEVETGTPVPLTISVGPEPRTTPDLRGLTLAEATEALEQLGLAIIEAPAQYSETVPEGQIISSIPGLNVEVQRGLEVTVTVSLGIPFVTVPDVVGMQAAEAADVLTAAGLVVEDTVGAPNRPVLVTDPPAGESVRKGTAVIIYTRR